MRAEPHFLLWRHISSEWSEASKKLMQSTHGFLKKQHAGSNPLAEKICPNFCMRQCQGMRRAQHR